MPRKAGQVKGGKMNEIKTEREEPKSNGRHALREMCDKRNEQKLEIARQNAEARAKRTPNEQFVLLDERLGKGIGAGKERMRLAFAIYNQQLKDSGEKMPASLKFLAQEIEVAKMESRAIRCLRKF